MSIQKHPLGSYFVVAFAFTWGMAGLILLNVLPLEVGFLIATFGPTIGAVVAGARGPEQGGLRAWLAGYGRWRVSPLAYLVALSPLVMVAIGIGVSALIGGDTAVPAAEMPAGFLLSTLVASLLIGPLGEEGGWRGYALPRLQRRFGALTGSLILGLVWIVWHLPVWLLPDTPMAEDPFLLWAVYCLALTVIITVAYNLGGGSTLIAIVTHTAANFATAFALGLGLLSVERFFTVVPFILVLYAAILVAAFGPKHLGTPPDRGSGQRLAAQSGGARQAM